MFTTSSWLVLVAVSGLAIVVFAPLHILLLLDLVLDPVQAWMFGQQGTRIEIFSILVDSTDLILVAILLGMTIRLKGERESRILAIPHLRLWLLLGLISSVAYLVAPARQEYIVGMGPARVVYQLLRYCWKPILFYPTAAILLSTEKRAGQALIVLTLVGDFASIIAIPQGYSGLRSFGPYFTPNSLAGVLIVPFLISVAGLVFPTSKMRLFFYLASIGLMGRALLFARSRGGFAAVLLGTACVLLFASLRAGSRARLLRLVASSVLGVFCLVLVKPGILERPTVQRFATTFVPQEQETFAWRAQERWSFYYAKVKQRPWTGYGTDVDESLENQTARTPHNGYLSLAMYSGIPVTIGYLIFAAMSLRRMARLSLRSTRTMTAYLALAIGAGVLGILGHNLVESTFTNVALVRKTFWLFAALALSLPSTEEQETLT